MIQAVAISNEMIEALAINSDNVEAVAISNMPIEAIVEEQIMSCFSKQFEAYAGEHKTLQAQITVQNNLTGCTEPLDLTGATAIECDFPVETGILTLSLLSSPPIVVDQAILGKVHIDLTPTETNQMVDGSLIFRVTKAGKVTIAVAVGAIKRLIIPGC